MRRSRSDDGVAVSDIRVRSLQASVAERDRPQQALRKVREALIFLGVRSGARRDWSLCGEIIWTGSTVNRFSVYCENMQTMIWLTISNLVRSVAVISMKTFFVVSLILECSELMRGGKEQTVLFASSMTG